MMGNKSARGVSIIGGADGPTSVFICSKGSKQPLKYRIRNAWYKRVYQIRRNWYEKHIKAEPHTMDEVCVYVQKELGFTEVSSEDKEYQRKYEETRASSLVRYAPELLVTYRELPRLQSHDEEEIRKHIELVEAQMQEAMSVPKELYDVDFHIFQKEEKGTKFQLYIEKREGYIGGSASGSKKCRGNEFDQIFKCVYKYYGVSQEDINQRSNRYTQLIRALSAR